MTVQGRSSEIGYPASRRFTFDVGRIGRAKHRVQALLEVDVTDARSRMKRSRRAGAPVSFSAWTVKVIADSVAEHPHVAGFNRPGRNAVVVFDDVDVALVIEREVDGSRVPLPYVIRAADSKSLAQIRGEIHQRTILHVTVLIDHDVVDGVPAARFVGDLVRRMEAGEGL